MMRNHKIVSKCNVFAWLCGRKDTPPSPPFFIASPCNHCQHLRTFFFVKHTFFFFFFCPLEVHFFLFNFEALFSDPNKITLFGVINPPFFLDTFLK